MPSSSFAKNLISFCNIRTFSLAFSAKSDSKTLSISAGIIISLTWVLQTNWTSDFSLEEGLRAGRTCFMMIRWLTSISSSCSNPRQTYWSSPPVMTAVGSKACGQLEPISNPTLQSSKVSNCSRVTGSFLTRSVSAAFFNEWWRSCRSENQEEQTVAANFLVWFSCCRDIDWNNWWAVSATLLLNNSVGGNLLCFCRFKLLLFVFFVLIWPSLFVFYSLFLVFLLTILM